MDNESNEQQKENYEKIFQDDQAMLKTNISGLLGMGLPTPGIEMALADGNGKPMVPMGGVFRTSVWDKIDNGAETKMVSLGGGSFIRIILTDLARKMSNEDVLLEWRRLRAMDGIRWRIGRMTTCLLVMAGIDPEAARSLGICWV